jgi:hypothetical protein
VPVTLGESVAKDYQRNTTCQVSTVGFKMDMSVFWASNMFMTHVTSVLPIANEPSTNVPGPACVITVDCGEI